MSPGGWGSLDDQAGLPDEAQKCKRPAGAVAKWTRKLSTLTIDFVWASPRPEIRRKATHQ